MFISALVALVGGSSTASAATRVVSAPAQVVTGTSVLAGIACHGHDDCVAVGSYDGEGVVVPITDGAPGSAELVTGTQALTAVSCPTTTFCVAVGYGPYTLPPGRMGIAGAEVPIYDGVPGGVVTIIGPGQIGVIDSVYLYGVGCSSANSCLVGGSDTYMGAVVVPLTLRGPGNEESVFDGVVNAVACRKTSFCVAVGQDESSKSAGTVVTVSYGKIQNFGGPVGTSNLDAVSCRSTAWCLTGGDNIHETEGVVALVVNQAPRVAEPVSGSTGITGVACRATTVDCLAVGDNSTDEGVVAGIYDGAPGTAHVVAGTEVLNGVACPSNTSCLVVGANGSGQGVVATIHLPPR